MKIDVEGAEGAVLRGAFETLRAHRPLLQVELHPGAMERFGDDADGLVKLLDGLGYDSTVHPMRACLKLSAIPRAPPVARSP